MTIAIWWIRRDLRLKDNQALAAALREADQVIPVFILDPGLVHSPALGEKRLGFLYSGLHSLDQDLRRRGNALVVRQGDPVEALRGLLEETGAQAIFAEADVSPYARNETSGQPRSFLCG